MYAYIELHRPRTVVQQDTGIHMHKTLHDIPASALLRRFSAGLHTTKSCSSPQGLLNGSATLQSPQDLGAAVWRCQEQRSTSSSSARKCWNTAITSAGPLLAPQHAALQGSRAGP